MSAPLTIYLLLDVSGSMSGAPLEAMRNGVDVLLSALRSDEELASDYVIPKPFDPRVGKAVAAAVAQAARDSGVARI